MEGFIARWYAKHTARSPERFRETARVVAAKLPGGGSVLEVAPGPGYLAIELAKTGGYRVVGLDISHTFVEIARRGAAEAGVEVTFERGNAADMPFAADSFDFVVCCAAFKNFTEPVRALEEMYRVLRAGGRALIVDMRPDATPQAIDDEVKKLGAGWLNSLVIKWTFKHMLVKRAYSAEQFRLMASQTSFRSCEIDSSPLGQNVWLKK
jgi:ubiquinone/menaquinone biosynthesis C-methylase UbiE